MSNHVYILGAGFSVPLGGPLFTQLLTWELKPLGEVPFSGPLGGPISHAIRALHLNRDNESSPRGLDANLGRKHRPLDAEELLSFIDWSERQAGEDWAGIKSVKVQRLISQTTEPELRNNARLTPKVFLGAVNKALKRVVASQCNSFVADLETGSDQIDPYIAWMRSLTADDTIVTFNYDIAVEKIAALSPRTLCANPGERDDNGRYPRLLKLHGSANWHLDEERVIENETAYSQDLDVCIGTPGMGKTKMFEIQAIQDQWHEARHAINEADYVSIVGYSMPATDNFARQWILDSLVDGQRVNLILGPDMGSVKSQRMQSMILPRVNRDGTNKKSVIDVKMYAQDYLAAVHRYRDYPYQ